MGKTRNTRAGRPRRTDITPDIEQLQKERDTYKWLLLLALRRLPENEMVVPSHELQTHLAAQLFDVAISPLPEGGAQINLVHVPALRQMAEGKSMEEVVDAIPND